jgi:dinuclear metal center YbgI/SA1388 family protein
VQRLFLFSHDMKTTVAQLVAALDDWAPRALQESYDNNGLLVGRPEAQVTAVLTCLDVTDAVLNEALERGCNTIVAHHPLVFTGLKQISESNSTQQLVRKAILHDLHIIACHTPLDNVRHGVNARLAHELGIGNTRILSPKSNTLAKLQTYVPFAHREAVMEALFQAGAGRIGDYSECSFTVGGAGSFRPLPGSQPFVGQVGERHLETEAMIAVVAPAHLQAQVVNALLHAHPYETVAYQWIPLANPNPQWGSGMVGTLTQPMAMMDFLNHLKQTLGGTVRYTTPHTPLVQTIALCGGSGSFLIPAALAAKADVFVTADCKYHQFFEAENRITIADVGHFESEQFTSDLIAEYLSEKFTNFASLKARVVTNPVHYL